MDEVAIKQKKQFSEATKSQCIRADQPGYLIFLPWFEKWKKFTGFPDSDPDLTIGIPDIDNSQLLFHDELKPTLTLGYDFEILTLPQWKLLSSWYKGGPKLKINMISHPITHKLTPLLYIWTFNIYYENKVYQIETHKYESIYNIKQKICQKLNLDPNLFRLIDYWNKNYLSPLKDSFFVFQYHLINTQELLLESFSPEPLIRKTTLPSRTSSSKSIASSLPTFQPTKNALVGFINLGNTCFFNSAMQALIHCRFLRNFFLSQQWRLDINESNVFSSGGLIANAFATLVNDEWTKDVKELSPKLMLQIFTKFAPRFGDHKQHDSHECLSTILDQLHEDLNRNNNRTYLEGVEGDGTNDSDFADEAWKRHTLQNDSIIVDLFHGQLRDEISCQECGKQRIIFDPFLSLSLPFPEEGFHSFRYLVVPYDLKLPRHIVKIYSRISVDMPSIIKEDFLKRCKDNEFNINPNNYEIIEKEDLSAELGVRLPPIYRKIDYFIFEILDPSKHYSIISLFMKQKRRAPDVIDGPVLIEYPFSTKSLSERFQYLWEPTKHPSQELLRKKEGTFDDDFTYLIEPNIFSDVVEGIPDSVESEKLGMKVAVIESRLTNEDARELINCPHFYSAIRVLILPKYMSTENGFSWGAVQPLNRDADYGSPPPDSLDDCLRCFLSKEELVNENQWYCPVCSKMVNAVSNLSIWSLPDILILHLKRFTGEKKQYAKNNTLVDFPEELDMNSYILGPQKEKKRIYHLFAVIHHLGSMAGGHYVVSVFIENKKKWFMFNDSSVYEIESKEVYSASAYVLLYTLSNSTCSN